MGIQLAERHTINSPKDFFIPKLRAFPGKKFLMTKIRHTGLVTNNLSPTNKDGSIDDDGTVSYTHLTLPTIYSV